jgi:FkbM family methyltransferase
VSFSLAPVRRLPRWNLTISLPCLYKTPAKVFYVFGEQYDENLARLPELLKSGDVFVDAGANFGVYSLLSARLVGVGGRVFAFEPIPQICELLRTNALRNNLAALKVMDLALAEHMGTASLALHADSGRSSLRPMKDDVVSSIEVRTSTLDQEIDPSVVVSVIKLDVEGFELSVLRGASRILRESRPLILFENNPDALSEASASTEMLVQELRGFGYEIYEWGPEEKLVEITPAGFGNFVALHLSDLRLACPRTLIQLL